MDSFALTRHTFPSGLRAVLLPREERQTVAFLVLIGVGSRYETTRQWGLSHFLEHMFFKGTQTRPTSKEIAEAIENLGGEFNAFTGEEFTGYYVKVAAQHLEKAAQVVADILLKPLFAAEEIEREKGVITEEIRMYTSMPMSHVRHLWQQALYGSHPLGRRIDGVEETVTKFARRDFVRYTTQHYHAKNVVVTLAGNFPQNPALTFIENLFSTLSPGEASHPKVVPARVPAERFVFERRSSLEQTSLVVGVPGISLTDERRWAAELLATILGGGMSSRLFLAIRERQGLAYSVRTATKSYVDTGSLATEAGVRVDKVELAMRLILAEYDRIMSETVAEAELYKAKQILNGQLALELEETNALALFAGGQELLEGTVMTPAVIKEHIEAVTPADIQAVAQQLLTPKLRTTALLGPYSSTKSLEKLLTT